MGFSARPAGRNGLSRHCFWRLVIEEVFKVHLGPGKEGGISVIIPPCSFVPRSVASLSVAALFKPAWDDHASCSIKLYYMAFCPAKAKPYITDIFASSIDTRKKLSQISFSKGDIVSSEGT